MSRATFSGKRVLITGCYSGMGEAIGRTLAEDGAEIHAIDLRKPEYAVASFHSVDLRETAAIDAAFADLPESFDSVFYCAGMPQTFPGADVVKVSFSSMRYFMQKVVERMPNGGSIGIISSTAGAGYMRRIPTVMEFISQPDFVSANAWYAAHAAELGDSYVFAKEASIMWTMWAGAEYIGRGIRVNCICPGPTSTPMMKDFESLSNAQTIDIYTAPIYRRATPQEQANALLFLNSDDATYVNGLAMNVDGGFVGAMTTGQISMEDLAAKAAQAAAAMPA